MLIELIAIGLSASAIAISIYAACRLRKAIHVKPKVDTVIGFRKYRRVKRYILLKVVCFSDIDFVKFSKTLISNLYKALGPELRLRCGLALVAYRPDIHRVILRVSGDPHCVKHVLVALTLRHLLDEIPCLTIPIRTSGLVSRLKKYLKGI